MRIFTSYFSNYRNFSKECDVFSIVRFVPEWSKFKNIIEFSPQIKTLNDYKDSVISEEEFIRIYKEEQSKVNHLEILKSLSDKEDIVLVCYEKPEDFCHRHILREVLKAKGIETLELSNQ